MAPSRAAKPDTTPSVFAFEGVGVEGNPSAPSSALEYVWFWNKKYKKLKIVAAEVRCSHP